MTGRAVLLGILVVVTLAWVTPYSDLQLKGTWIAACHLPVGALFIFLVLAAALNPLIRRVAKRAALTSRELIVIYTMSLAGAGIPSFGLTAYLIPTLAGAGYFATPENGWANWFYRFVPQWFVPFDLTAIANSPVTGKPALYRLIPGRFQPGDPEILRQFYEGLPAGRPIPWEPWVVPLACWSLVAAALFCGFLGLGVLLRRQWVEGERLTFPLVQLPLALVAEPEEGVLPPFLRNPAVWIGFALPQLVHLVNGLHTYFPAVPGLELRVDLTRSFTSPPWNQLGIFWLWVHFSVIGLTFLLPPDFSFSLWFFYLFYKLEGALLVQLGHPLAFMPNYPVPRYAGLQMLGAFVALTGYLLYAARPHFQRVWLTLWRRDGQLDDSDEPVSYRTAVALAAGGPIAAAALLAGSGADFLWALLAVTLLLVVILVLTRMIAEGGLLFVQAPFRPTDMILTFTAAPTLGPRNLTVFAFFERIFAFDVRATLWPYLQDSFRLADGPSDGWRLRRRLTAPLVLSVVLAMVVSYAAVLHTAYRYGAVTQQGWFMIGSPQQPFARLVNNLAQPQDPVTADWLTAGLGGTVLLALCLLRNQFAGFPLHPLGFAMGPSWPLIQLWFSLFLGWACKAGILRIAGMKGYRQAYPFFLGMVLGEFTAAGFWIVVGVLAGGDTSYRFLLT